MTEEKRPKKISEDKITHIKIDDIPIWKHLKDDVSVIFMMFEQIDTLNKNTYYSVRKLTSNFGKITDMKN